MALFPSSRPGIRVRVLPRFPARVVEGAGISADIASGTMTIGLDYPALADNAGVPDPSRFTAALYNLDTEAYEEIRLDQFPTPSETTYRTPRGDADYIITNLDRNVALTAALTAPRTWSLPAANSVPAGRVLVIRDEVGGISGTNTLTIARTSTDTVNGGTNHVLSVPRSGVALQSDGTSSWTFLLVQTDGLADKAVTAAKIADDTITAAQIAPNAIGSSELADNAVTNAKMADNSVNTAEIMDGAVTAAKQASIATASLIGRVTAGTGTREVLTGAQAAGILPTIRHDASQTLTLAQRQQARRNVGLNSAYAEYLLNADISTTIPYDDTIPQNTEGAQILSVTVNVSDPASKVRLTFSAAASSGTTQGAVFAIFRAGVASAIRAVGITVNGNSTPLNLLAEDSPGASGAITYTLRCGPQGATAIRLNGGAGGRFLGGSWAATLTADEVPT